MRRVFVIVAALACALAAPRADAVVHKIDEGASYFYNGDNGGRSFTRTVFDVLWCAYMYYGNYQRQIRVAYSQDNGTTWKPLLMTEAGGAIPGGTANRNPAVVTDSDGYLHFIWLRKEANGTASIKHATYRSGAWADFSIYQRTVADGFTPDTNEWEDVAAALDSRDRIHAVWSRKTGDASTKLNVYYAVFSGGTTGHWDAPRRLKATDDRDQLSPSVAVDPSDNVYVAYYGYPSSGVGEIKLLSGPNLDQLKGISESAYRQLLPCVACDAQGNVHIAWIGSNESGRQDLYYRMRDAGGAWHDVERVNNDTSWMHTNCSVATDMNGKIYIVGSANMDGAEIQNVVRYTRFINDVGWGNATSLATDDEGWHTRDVRALHSYWPLHDGLPVNIPKARYAYYFDIYHEVPGLSAPDKYEVRAGVPKDLTWMGQNYAELRIIPATTGGFTYAPNEQLTLEWKVYPEAFDGLEDPHSIYFGAWKNATVDGRSATVDEVVRGGGSIFLYKGTTRSWFSFLPGLFAWQNVSFPLPGDVRSGRFTFTIPPGIEGKWAFVIAVVDPVTGAFIASPEVACSQYFWVE